MTARLQFLVQDTKVSLEYVDFYTKESLILDARVSISTTPLTLVFSLNFFGLSKINALKDLINAGEDVNMIDVRGKTPLMLAAG